jgi:DNA polymerase III delta prime subunit
VSDPPVLLLTGPPGVGKTTTARVLADREERAAHVEADHFFHFIRSGFVEPWRAESRRQNETVMRIVADTAGAYAAAGYFTIVDGIILPRYFLDPLRHRLSDRGQHVAYAVLRGPSRLLQVKGARTSPHAARRAGGHRAPVARLRGPGRDGTPRRRHRLHEPRRGRRLLAERLRDGSLAT